MIRKCASFAFGLALLVALGFAIARSHTLKIPGGSSGFSASCEPASSAFEAASELQAVSTPDAIGTAEDGRASAGVVRRSRVETIARSIPRPAPWVFPALLHRPPPAHS